MATIHTHINSIKQFYTAFQNKEAEKMVTLYDDNVLFQDPAFGQLKGEEAKNMWRMLCSSAKDLKITFELLEADDDIIKVHWEANYTFSKTGRRVHNKIDAEFIFKNGLIIKHTDHFNLWIWSQQALGISGWLLGWSSFFRQKMHKSTRKLLAEYSSNN